MTLGVYCHAACVRRINLGGEGNTLYPVLYLVAVVVDADVIDNRLLSITCPGEDE